MQSSPSEMFRGVQLHLCINSWVDCIKAVQRTILVNYQDDDANNEKCTTANTTIYYSCEYFRRYFEKAFRKKWNFPLTISLVSKNLRERSLDGMVTFTKEILNEKLNFWCCGSITNAIILNISSKSKSTRDLYICLWPKYCPNLEKCKFHSIFFIFLRYVLIKMCWLIRVTVKFCKRLVRSSTSGVN